MAVQRMETNGNHHTVVNQNANAMKRKEAWLDQKNGGQVQNGSINISELNGKLDSILMRRQRAQRKAMKVVSDAWNLDKKFDSGLQERRAHVKELQESFIQNRDELDKCNADLAEIKELYGVEEGSWEEKDVELARLWNKYSAAAAISKKFDSVEVWEEMTNVSLSQEDWQRMTELEGKISSPTLYQQRALEIGEKADFFEKNMKNAQIDLQSEDSAIRMVKIERLKKQGMVKARKEADEINEAAAKETISMLIGEAQDHIDEKMEEKKEEAKEKAEEKEEQEEKIEEQREQKELQQAQLALEQEESHIAEETRSEQRRKSREQAELIEDAVDDESLSGLSTSEAKLAIKEMLQKMKLLEEDLKGAALDARIEDV
ncbi:MAG: hypothetical protein NC314_03975 [Roseburia sp.]|nr:hypothetical protein [Roseburia sp.]MCM1241975.1 hypothetical protein [Roseburia sp.]